MDDSNFLNKKTWKRPIMEDPRKGSRNVFRGIVEGYQQILKEILDKSLDLYRNTSVKLSRSPHRTLPTSSSLHLSKFYSLNVSWLFPGFLKFYQVSIQIFSMFFSRFQSVVPGISWSTSLDFSRAFPDMLQEFLVGFLTEIFSKLI